MSLKEGSVRSPADKACDVQRDGINIFCFITLHKERNIQQSLPPETGLGRGNKHNLGKRRLLPSNLGT